MHYIFYTLHILGMLVIIFTTLFLIVKKDIQSDQQKKFSVYLMSAAHTQLLSGLGLFFLMLSDVNHLKIGIKILFAIDIAVLATIYKKKIFQNIVPSKILLISVLLSAILITLVAFLA